MTAIRDPLHGSIEIDERERAVLDSRPLQRLRFVRQLGFSEMAFPGATHSRYSHVLGACHVVGRLFDALHGDASIVPDETERRRLRAAVRVAMLLHDVGHAPFSHSSEAVMPPRRTLELPEWTGTSDGDERASHEDYGLKLILDSELTSVLETNYASLGLPVEAIASLLAGREAPGGPYFRVGAVDHGPLLRQVISGELDADRMDYLLRDSFFSGVNYGKYDHTWLIAQLRVHLQGSGDDAGGEVAGAGRSAFESSAVERSAGERSAGASSSEGSTARLSLRHRGIFAFEDFLLSRYHMFLSVYYHHTPVCFDRMLLELFREEPETFQLPGDAEGYLRWDDLSLLVALRDSSSEWARRIVRRRPFKVAAESNPYRPDEDLAPVAEELVRRGIEHFATRSESMVSRYFGEGGRTGILVEAPGRQGHVPLEEYTPFFQRHDRGVRIERLYVAPESVDEARSIARDVR